MGNGRTNYGTVLATMQEFLYVNRRLLLFLALMLAGVFAGVWIFSASYTQLAGELEVMLKLHPLSGGFAGGMSQLFSSCMSLLVMLAVLFLAGLSACGAPVSFVVPLFYGLGLGLTEAYYYASSGTAGIGLVALLVLPHSLLAATALMLGCSESLRMSLQLTRQLLPGGALGGLWHDFQLYCVRFLLFVVIAFASGIVDVCLRLVGNALLT